MKAPISVCVITRNDPHLDNCLASIRDYVEEIVVVRTSDTDIISAAIANKYADTFDTFTDCNKDDKIVDFAMARNHSISLATQPWIFWIDSDDVISGADKLLEITQKYDPTNRSDIDTIGILFPYEYSYDENGKCTCRHFRERLVYGRDFHFVSPVHEVLIPKPGKRAQMLSLEDVSIRHQRQYLSKPADPYRNLRILENYFANGGTDPRSMYYIGLEYSNTGNQEKSIQYLTDYVKVSGWDDEKAMAMIKLVDIYQALAKIPEGLHWAHELLKVKHNWFETFYALCRMYYFLGDFQKAVYYGKLANDAPPTETLLFVDSTQRSHLHTYLNVALNNTGQTQEAYRSTLAGLRGLPSDPRLLNNKLVYERFLKIEQPITKAEFVFVTAPGCEPWSPETVKKTGIGGSEMMLINMAKGLATTHDVHVYADCEGKFDNVHYHYVKDFHHIECDVLIVSRYAQFLHDDYNVKANLKLLWVHDVMIHGATNELLLKADTILALTHWHKEYLMKAHNISPDHITVTRNGIDQARFHKYELTTDSPIRNQYKCVNSSSPDRSWPVLLEIWPEIRKRVPQAELHLYYGFHNWKVMAANDPLQMDTIARLEKQINETEGVIYHDRVNQDELAKEFMSAGCWLFPTHYAETSCISAMEAQRARLHIVTSKLAGLIETVGDCGTLIEGTWTDPEYKRQFIEATVKALNTSERQWGGTQFDITTLGFSWLDMFDNMKASKKVNGLLHSYCPTRRYKDRKPEMTKLNIACGPNVFPFDGWINYDNADFTEYFNYVQNVQSSAGMPDHQVKLWEYCRGGGKIKYVRQDMTKPFPHVDNSVDCIYVGQAIEHINPVFAVPRFLAECYRMLKPGGVLRMTTPDLDKLINKYKTGDMNDYKEDQPAFYSEMDPSMQLALIMFGSSGDNSSQTSYEGHQCLYTERSLKNAMEKAGFTDFFFPLTSRSSRNADMANEVVDCGLSHSFIIEGVK